MLILGIASHLFSNILNNRLICTDFFLVMIAKIFFPKLSWYCDIFSYICIEYRATNGVSYLLFTNYFIHEQINKPIYRTFSQ